MDDITFYWLVVGVLFLMIELAHPGLFLFLSFSCGAVGGALASWFGFSLMAQCISALLVTMGALVVLMYFVKAHEREQQRKAHQSNVYALLGKKGSIIKPIQAGKAGQVKVGGEVWAARTIGDERIEEGVEVCVLNVRGAHVVVQRISKKL